jgi:hypothetical protein
VPTKQCSNKYSNGRAWCGVSCDRTQKRPAPSASQNLPPLLVLQPKSNKQSLKRVRVRAQDEILPPPNLLRTESKAGCSLQTNRRNHSHQRRVHPLLPFTLSLSLSFLLRAAAADPAVCVCVERCGSPGGWRSGDILLIACSAVRRVREDGEEAIGSFRGSVHTDLSVTVCFATGTNFSGEH